MAEKTKRFCPEPKPDRQNLLKKKDRGEIPSVLPKKLTKTLHRQAVG
jgi:hypothetical protein